MLLLLLLLEEEAKKDELRDMLLAAPASPADHSVSVAMYPSEWRHFNGVRTDIENALETQIGMTGLMRLGLEHVRRQGVDAFELPSAKGRILRRPWMSAREPGEKASKAFALNLTTPFYTLLSDLRDRTRGSTSDVLVGAAMQMEQRFTASVK